MRARLLLAIAALVAALPTAAAEPVPVDVGIVVVNVGNYDATKGTYLLDFYLWFRFDPSVAPPDFSPERFEFMNGRATAKDRLTDETAEDGKRELWYRIQANLYSDPRFARYPYDRQVLEITLEDAVHDRDALLYVPLTEASGLDESARIAGWSVTATEFTTVAKGYTFDETYDRARFTIEVERAPVSTTLKAFLPPAAFVVVSGLSFFLHPSKVAQRLGLGTSMIISAILFHVSQTVALPPLSQLILFDKVMISVYVFLAGSLGVTTLIAIDEDYWTEKDHTAAINRWGFAAATLLAVLTFTAFEILG